MPSSHRAPPPTSAHFHQSSSTRLILGSDLFSTSRGRIPTPSSSSVRYHSVRSKSSNVDSDTASPSDQSSSSSSSSPSDEIRDAYQSGETDAILTLAPKLIPDHSAEELILASVSAVSGNKGQAAGIINALLGSCAVDQDDGIDSAAAAAAETAWTILEAYDDLSDDIEIYPDVVTLCVAYTALIQGGEEDRFSSLAEDVLDRARRMAKKAGGSRLRKAIASSRRKRGSGGAGGGKSVRAMDVAEDLAELYGPELRVLHEDDNLMVLSKPSGMVCFHKRKTTAGKLSKKKRGKRKGGGGGGGSKDGGGGRDCDTEERLSRNVSDISLEDAMADVGVPLSALNPDGRGIVHRIDRGTSGCIVLAKTDEAHARLVAEFFTRGARKRYDALVPAAVAAVDGSDDPPTELEDSGVIELPIGGRPALSRYEVRDRYGDNALRLGVETMTGRKHQVRVHCAKALGRPLFLDPLYFDSDSASAAVVPESVARSADGTRQRFFLHASALSIPKLGIDVKAPLPLWWEVAIEGLNKDFYA